MVKYGFVDSMPFYEKYDETVSVLSDKDREILELQRKLEDTEQKYNRLLEDYELLIRCKALPVTG